MIWFWISAGSAAVMISAFVTLAVGYRRAKRSTLPPLGEPQHVTVIVAAHNEEANLPALFDGLRAQTYPHSHIHLIIANDRSTDDTYRIARDTDLDGISTQIVNITDVPDGASPKKHALARAIELATTEYLLFTDADCVPQSGWVDAMVRGLQIHEVVLGRAPLAGRDVQQIQESPPDNTAKKDAQALVAERTYSQAAQFAMYEARRTELFMMGAAGLGVPYMSIGRNWAYRKSVYDDTGGLEPLFKHLGGDDDLLLQRFKARGASIGTATDPHAATLSPAPQTWRALFRQKRRHYGVSGQYSLDAKAVLGGIELLSWVCVISAILSILGGDILWNYSAPLIPVILIASLNATVNLVPRTILVYADWIWEIVHMLFTTTAGLAGLFKSRTW